MSETELLSDLQSISGMHKLIDAFAKNHGNTSKTPDHVCEIISFTHKNFVEPVFNFSESPIETIFLNSLAIHFVAQMPMGLYIKSPLRDCLEYINFCYELWDALTYIYNNMSELQGEEISYEEFMKMVEKVSFDSEDNSLLNEANLFGSLLSWKVDFVCLVMQARFPNVLVDGKSIRTDMCIFSPKYKDLRFIVECDGYMYHSDKNSFKKDRIRDRKLKEIGFDVFRFSGSEINSNPLKSSYDLFSHVNRVLKNSKNHIS